MSGSSESAKSGAKDFDFLIGTWKILNKRLKERLKGSNEWEEFEAEHEARSILNGLGNIDQLKVTRDGKYFEGVSLRLFNPETHKWSIYWVVSETDETSGGMSYGDVEA